MLHEEVPHPCLETMRRVRVIMSPFMFVFMFMLLFGNIYVVVDLKPMTFFGFWILKDEFPLPRHPVDG
ncbi:MAG: hypothetical protein J5799_01805 [Bacteroidales bacterium]|nr:hypothetical protein [Bacteroidales bacterium]